MENSLALHNTKMLSVYAGIDERVRVLGYTVKCFTKVGIQSLLNHPTFLINSIHVISALLKYQMNFYNILPHICLKCMYM